MADLLLVENDERLTELKCPGTNMLLWPMVRTPFLRMILSDLFYKDPIPTSISTGGLKQVAGISQATLHNIFSLPISGKILIRTSAIGSEQCDGKRFNRMSDYLRDCEPENTVVLEDLGGKTKPRNRYNSRVAYHDPILLHARIAGLYGYKKYLEFASSLVELVEHRSRASVGWSMPDEKKIWYVHLVARYIARAPYLLAAYRSLMCKLGTKVLIAEEACYGNSMTCLIAAARSLGIPSAELQHGMIAPGHDAYSLAPILYESDTYKKMLPDYFLSYGPWWNSQLHVPVSPVTLGNPHGVSRRENAKQLQKNNFGKEPKNNILILSDGIESQLYINLAKDLAELIPERKILLRPHPIERSFFDQNFHDGKIGQVRIDTNVDIYSSLVSAYAVVSEISTGLFEGIGLAERVFMWQTPKAKFYLPESPFETFSDAGTLANALRQNNATNPVIRESDVWAGNWQLKYREFLQEVLSI